MNRSLHLSYLNSATSLIFVCSLCSFSIWKLSMSDPQQEPPKPQRQKKGAPDEPPATLPQHITVSRKDSADR